MKTATSTNNKQTILQEGADQHASVKAWAVFGMTWFALYAYVIFSWVTGPYFTPVEQGPSEIPDWMAMVFKIYVPFGICLFFICFYYFVIRPIRREKKWTSDALLFICFMFFVLQDPMINYWAPVFTYNSALFNMGGWVAYIPGWQSIMAGEPGATMGYPLLFLLPAYCYMLYTIAILCTWLMRKTKERYPGASNLTLISVSLFFGFFLDLILEGTWVRMGFYNYWGVDPAWTLFYGHYYQFPLYEAILTSVWWTGFACMRYYVNDKGENIFERGIEDMKTSQTVKSWMRFFALMAGSSCIYMITYNLPYQFWNLQGHAWPKDVQERSYFTNGICGPGTDQACPAKHMPNAKWKGVHFDPQGNVVVPKGIDFPGRETVKKHVDGKTMFAPTNLPENEGYGPLPKK